MAELREALTDMLIRKFGFEDYRVITFCEMCQKYPDTSINDKMLTRLANMLMREYCGEEE